MEQEALFERVYTIDVWYDGAREGVADYQGRPHRYQTEWVDVTNDDVAYDEFRLTPVSEETLARMRERHAIFRRWNEKRRLGWRPPLGETPPALPEERARYEKLDKQIEQALKESRGTFNMAGRFKYGAVSGDCGAVVQWFSLPKQQTTGPR